jgi:hypothetical protein
MSGFQRGLITDQEHLRHRRFRISQSRYIALIEMLTRAMHAISI